MIKSIPFYFFLLFCFVAEGQCLKTIALNCESGQIPPHEKQVQQCLKEIRSLSTKQGRFYIEIRGYTDESGSDSLNALLAKKRGEWVHHHLLSAQLDNSRFQLKLLSGNTGNLKKRCVQVKIYQSYRSTLQGLKGSTFQISAEKSHRLQTPDKHFITIPDNCFETSSHQLAKGEIQIQFVSYQTPSDFICSGIPMSVIDSSQNIHFFTSSGMFSLRAYQQQEELQIRKEKKIKIELNASADPRNSQFYQLDTLKGEWKERRGWDSRNIEIRPPVSKVAVLAENSRIQRIGDLGSATKSLEILHLATQIGMNKNAVWLKELPYSAEALYQNEFPTNTYQIKIVKEEKQGIQFLIRSYSPGSPYSGIIFETRDKTILDLRQRIWVNSYITFMPNREFAITLKSNDQTKLITCRCTQADQEKSLYTIANQYSIPEASNGYSFSHRTQQKYHDSLVYLYEWTGKFLPEINRNNSLETWYDWVNENKEDFLQAILSFKKTYGKQLEQWAAEEKKEAKQKRDLEILITKRHDSLNTLSQDMLKCVYQNIEINQVGIYNCDDYTAIKNRLEVTARYYDEQGKKIQAFQLHCVMENTNTVLTYSYNNFKIHPEQFSIDEKAAITLVLIDINGKKYYCGADNFLQARQKGTHIPVTPIKDGLSSSEIQQLIAASF